MAQLKSLTEANPDPVDWRILTGDCVEMLSTEPDESVQCVVTSPPYWGLRDYGVKGQIGLESTPEEYVKSMVEVFRDVWRVLKIDGTVWLNLGDSYANTGKSGGGAQGKRWKEHGGRTKDCAGTFKYAPPRLKPKDLVGIPWRVALALQADGWWLRSDTIEQVEFYCPCGCGYIMEERIWRYSQDRDIIWHKPNPMPESVTDRPTRAHEYVFLLTKSAKYFYDADALREPTSESFKKRFNSGAVAKRNPSPQGLGASSVSGESCFGSPDGKRNKRTVWTIPTQSYRGAHFATFPEKLVEPCILAGCPTGSVVLDPFCGSGTVGVVALRHRRRFLGVELNPEYVKLAEARIGVVEGDVDAK